MRSKRTIPVVLSAVALAAGAGASCFRATAQDEARRETGAKKPCPRCFKPARAGDVCNDDGSVLLPIELVGLHLALRERGDAEVRPGIRNPLHDMRRPDGSIDVERLKKLVSDYEAAAKSTKFGTADVLRGPGDGREDEGGARVPVSDPSGGPRRDPGTSRAYAGRSLGGRRNLVARGGGSIATESAVEAGLRWLARHQADDGHWDATGYSRQCKGGECDGGGLSDFDVGITGLSVLAFLGTGCMPQNRASYYVDSVDGRTLRFGDVVKKGLKYLLVKQNDDGAIGPQTGEMMYNHAIATLALVEAYGMTNAASYKAPAQKALDFLQAAQNPGLGWRYTPRSGNNDTSVTGWCVTALKAGQAAGLEVADRAFAGAKTWLNRVTDANGQVGYDRLGSGEIFVPGKNDAWAHHPTMSAIGLLARLEIDRKKTDPSLAKSAAIVSRDLPEWDPKPEHPKNDFYYWFHGTQALFELDGPAGPLWQRWNRAVADALCQNQRIRKDGCKDGSWDTDHVDRWAYAGGRVYGTAINVLTLEVYYRTARVVDSDREVTAPGEPEKGTAIPTVPVDPESEGK